MSFLSLKQSLIYLMYDHGLLRDVFFGSRQLSAKILPTLGYKPNPSIPIIFDTFSLKCLKIAWLPGKTKNTVSLRFIFFENYPFVALTCSSLLISSSPHFWELFLCCKVFEIAKLGSSTLLAELSFRHTFNLVRVVRVANSLFKFAHIACLLHLWIKKGDIDYSIWAMPK